MLYGYFERDKVDKIESVWLLNLLDFLSHFKWELRFNFVEK